MTKYLRYSVDGYQYLDIVCDDLKEYRHELAFMRKLKREKKDSYNPIVEVDYGDDGLGFEFFRLHDDGATIRVIYRSDD